MYVDQKSEQSRPHCLRKLCRSRAESRCL